jgi:hypothetical protein
MDAFSTPPLSPKRPFLKLEADAYEKIDPRISGVVSLLEKRFKN